MKKGLKIIAVILFFLVVAAGGYCFWRGWVQFLVPTDSCGIMISKTGGVYEKPIEKGRFVWRWEPLLPTNARVQVFSMQSQSFRKTVQGSLPSAEIYSLQIQQAPDFSYRFDFAIDLQVSPDELVALVKTGVIQTPADLQPYLERTAERVAALVSRYLMQKTEKEPQTLLTSYGTEQILSGIKSDFSADAVLVRGITVLSAKVPDVELYEKAKATFDGFQKLVDTELASLARKQAEAIVSDNRAVNKLTKIGETLKKYPELSDVLKNSDTAAVLKALDRKSVV